MALSLSNFLISLTVFLLYGRICAAATVTYDFNISWVEADPASIGSTRPVIGINGQWPLPPIEVTKGDQVIVNAYNGLGNETTSLHFHGIFMNGSTHMDGAAQVSQCAIPTGGRFTYNFTVDQPGTYWYHSHVKGQYPDGLRGPFIIRDPSSPHKDLYDEERILTISDWYHDMGYPLLKAFMSYTNPTGAEPVPDVALMNDTQNLHINVQPGKTYMFRMVNMAAFAAQYFWIEGHTMRIVEVDGVYTEPTEAKMLYLTAAQRYSILVTMKNDTSSNFAVVGSMDTDMFDTVPNGLNANVTGWLVYDESKPLPAPTDISKFDPFDDFTLVPEDGEKIFDKVDYTMTLDLKMDNLGDGANYAFFNDVSYATPKVPTLYTALSSGASATNVEIYGHNTNSFVLRKNDIVEIVLNNNDPGKHPFHLHGHNFQVVSRSDTDAGPFDANNASMTGAFPNAPMRRDTILVHPNSNLVLRFRADNPGIWLFHCHIEWHTASGLITTFIESPLDLQSSLSIPQDHWDVCSAQQIPTKGNAAGNTVDLLDLMGEPSAPPPLPAGFTARGIVALVFSCVCAFLGMAVIVWYGAAPIAAGGKVTGSANGHDAAANGSAEASKATALEIVAPTVN